MASNKQMFMDITKQMKQGSSKIGALKQNIKTYCNNGFNINSKGTKGRTLAHYVVKNHIYGLMNFLQKLGLNLDICDDNYDSPLHYAVKTNQEQIVKELIKCGIDINIAAEFDATPLHIAVTEGNVSIVKMLLKAGVDYTLVDEKNLTALDYAKDEHNEQIITILNNIERKN